VNEAVNGPSSTTEVRVQGTIQIEGKPPSKGTVVFDPTNINRPKVGVRRTTIERGGTYSIATLIGPNKVTVEAPETEWDASLRAPLYITVKEGESTVDLMLPSDWTKPGPPTPKPKRKIK
jgi:hypothetical protein